MKVELELKNGRRKAFPEAIAKVLVKRGVGRVYQTRDMRAEVHAASSPAVIPPAIPLQEEAIPAAETSEVDQLRAQLDERGIPYHHRAGATKLRELLEG